MSPTDLISTGAVLLAVVGIAYGGTFMLRVTTGKQPANDLQKGFFRAGHAHAGVLVILGLLVRVIVTEAGVPGWSSLLADGVLIAAILMPAGFFLSVVGSNPERPNALRALIWLGAASLTIGLIGAGVGLISTGLAAR